MKAMLLLTLTLAGCASKPKLDRPFYYQATTKDKTIYVLGTYNVGFNVHELPPGILKDLEQSDLVIAQRDDVEARKIQKLRVEFQRKYLKEHLLDKFELKKNLSASAWDRLSYMLSKAEIQEIIRKDLPNYREEELSPSFVLKLSYYLMEHQMWFAFKPRRARGIGGFYHTLGNNDLYHEYMGQELVALARQKKVEVLSLEHATDLQMRGSDIEDKALHDLEHMYGDEARDENERIEKTMELYRKGDEDSYFAFRKEKDLTPKIVKENEAWASEILKAPQKKIFVEAWVMHVLGPQGILEYLKKAGAKIERVTPK